MTNTIRDRFEKWYINRGVGMLGFNDAFEGYKAAHADMLPVLERVREALIEAIKSHDNLYMAHFNNQEMCDRDLAIIPAKLALTELEAIMKPTQGGV